MIFLKKKGTCTLRSFPPTRSASARTTRVLAPVSPLGQMCPTRRLTMVQSVWRCCAAVLFVVLESWRGSSPESFGEGEDEAGDEGVDAPAAAGAGLDGDGEDVEEGGWGWGFSSAMCLYVRASTGARRAWAWDSDDRLGLVRREQEARSGDRDGSVDAEVAEANVRKARCGCGCHDGGTAIVGACMPRPRRRAAAAAGKALMAGTGEGGGGCPSLYGLPRSVGLMRRSEGGRNERRDRRGRNVSYRDICAAL